MGGYMDKHAMPNPSLSPFQKVNFERQSCFNGDRRILEESHKIMRAYNASVSAYNSGSWDASVALCGKVLENIARTELSFTEQNGNLAQLVEKLIKAVNTDQPLVELAASLKDGHGLGAHFDMERESNQQIAEITLDLIECFISYLYVFRLRIHQLKQLSAPQAEPEDELPKSGVLTGLDVPIFEDAGRIDDADYHPPTSGNSGDRFAQPMEGKPTEFQP
tara:strand:+ start:4986 stop:5645 length:660 start_codon:yes stop_codon:yes gene_type:complete